MAKWNRKRGEVLDPKPCSKCGIEKPLTDFRKMASNADGHQSECRSCSSERSAARYKTIREDKSKCWCGRPAGEKTRHCESCRASANASTKRVREFRIAKGLCQSCAAPAAPHTFCERCECLKSAKVHGGTLDVRKALWEAQGRSCPICEKSIKHYVRQKNCVVDHDHVTGKTRGLLHDHCNRSLVSDHTPATARCLVLYLEKYLV